MVEGIAIEFNKKDKVTRRYYPLFCTVAQADEVLDLHHRQGNVHGSKGALEFMDNCLSKFVKQIPPAGLSSRHV